jgi:hypothetical protein
MNIPPPPAQNARIPTISPGAAEAARTTWLALQSALVPIIGQGGFIALYRRCLHLAQPAYPWLSEADESGERHLRFEPLLQALSRESSPAAAQAQEHLVRTFLSVLANLIGPALAQRLLGSVVVLPPSSPSEQNTPS